MIDMMKTRATWNCYMSMLIVALLIMALWHSTFGLWFVIGIEFGIWLVANMYNNKRWRIESWERY